MFETLHYEMLFIFFSHPPRAALEKSELTLASFTALLGQFKMIVVIIVKINTGDFVLMMGIFLLSMPCACMHIHLCHSDLEGSSLLRSKKVPDMPAGGAHLPIPNKRLTRGSASLLLELMLRACGLGHFPTLASMASF